MDKKMARVMLLDEKGVSALAELIKGTGKTIVQSLKTEKSIRQLARDLKLAPSTICYHLDRLEKLGLVEKIEREHGDRRVRLYKATGISTAYLILLNFPKEERDALKRDLSDALSKKGLIIRDIVSLFLAIGAGLGIWVSFSRRMWAIPQVMPYPMDLVAFIADILLVVALLTAVAYLQRARIFRLLRRIKSAFS